MLSPGTYVDMALFIGSDLDLGNASADELRELFVEAVAAGFGFQIREG